MQLKHCTTTKEGNERKNGECVHMSESYQNSIQLFERKLIVFIICETLLKMI
jgi:hypothetical protein